MHETRCILIIRPSALGDVCRTVPVLVSLRRAFPEARIDWVVQDSFADAIRAHPDLNGVIPFPRGRFARWWRPRVWAELAGWLRRLRRRRYDLVIDCQGLSRSGLMTLVTGARRRVGLRGAREFGWLGYNLARRTEPGLHTVDEMLSLVELLAVPAVRCLRLYVPEADRHWWQEARPAGRYAVLAPTSRWVSKRWPAARWRDLIDPLLERGFDSVVLIGAPGEVEQVMEVCPAVECDERRVNLAGRTTVGQTMAIVERADLVIANDSAPLHMAVGLASPCVGLFGPTDPARVGPYGRPESVIRAPLEPRDQVVGFKDRQLGDRLMRRITMDDVLERVDRVSMGAARGDPIPQAPR
jgi:lipopolysaccharide heptosyltransferase I